MHLTDPVEKSFGQNRDQSPKLKILTFSKKQNSEEQREEQDRSPITTWSSNVSRIIEDDGKRSLRIGDILKRIKAKGNGSMEAKEDPGTSTRIPSMIFKKKNSEQVTGESRIQQEAERTTQVDDELGEGNVDYFVGVQKINNALPEKVTRSGKSLDRIVKGIQDRLNSRLEIKLRDSRLNQKTGSPQSVKRPEKFELREEEEKLNVSSRFTQIRNKYFADHKAKESENDAEIRLEISNIQGDRPVDVDTSSDMHQIRSLSSAIGLSGLNLLRSGRRISSPRALKVQSRPNLGSKASDSPIDFSNSKPILK